DAVPTALITHLHYDHWAGHSLFPAAEFWVQRDEIAFWTGPFARYEAFSGSQNVGALTNLVPLNYAGRIKVIDGDREVLPGLRGGDSAQTGDPDSGEPRWGARGLDGLEPCVPCGSREVLPDPVGHEDRALVAREATGEAFHAHGGVQVAPVQVRPEGMKRALV